MSEKREPSYVLTDYKQEGEEAKDDVVEKLLLQINESDRQQQMEKMQTPVPLYRVDEKSVINLLDTPRNLPTDRHGMEVKISGESGAVSKPSYHNGAAKRDYEVKPHVAENDNIVMPPVMTEPGSRPGEVSDFMGGMDVASEQVELTWQNVFKNIEKMTTRDEEKRREIDAELDAISKKYDELPQTRGVATASAMASNVLGVGLPMIIAGVLGGPEVATVVGGGVVLSDILSTLSQADMEMDAFEQSSGKQLTKQQRASYSTALTATNLIMNTLLSRGLLKGATKSQQRELSKQLTKQIYENPVAQQEFNTMTRRVLDRERKDRAKEVVRSGIDGGLSSAAMEAEKSIYTGEAPELENILSAALGGTLAASAQSGVSMGINARNLHESRMNSDKIYYASNVDNKGKSAEPIREILPTEVKSSTDGKKVNVEAEVVHPGRNDGRKSEYDQENVVSGSYARAMDDPMVHEMYEDMQITPERSEMYEKQWAKTKNKDGEPDYRKQNEIVQQMAAEMGLPIQVYARIDDLPPDYAKIVRKNGYGGITTENGGTAIVLELCQNTSAHNIEAIIRHENLGHKGMRRLYSDQEAYQNELYKAGLELIPEDMRSPRVNTPGFRANVEERASLKSEIRPYSIHGTPNTDEKPYEKYDLLYRLLERSEEASRNSTTNELRKHNKGIGGNPMPQLYEWPDMNVNFLEDYNRGSSSRIRGKETGLKESRGVGKSKKRTSDSSTD